MLQVIPNSQIYTDINQLIATLESLKCKVQYPNSIGRVETEMEIDYILIGLQNSKKEGFNLKMEVLI